MRDLDDAEINLFKEWYFLDKNYLESPCYVLQPRSGEYIDDLFYEDFVVGRLKHILSKVCMGEALDSLCMSATAQEIYQGLDEETSRYTFIYQRRLVQVPDEKISSFVDNGQEESLRRNILDKYLENNKIKDNCLYVISDFTSYYRGDLDERISSIMTSKLEKIIDGRIKEISILNISENQHHISLAERYEGKITGRGTVFTELENYINSDSRRAFIMTAESGIGKSAVMYELVNRLKQREDIGLIVRFCGETHSSSDPWLLLESVMNDIYKYTEGYKKSVSRGHYSPLKINRGEREGWGSFMKVDPIDIFNFKATRPIVVLLDSIDAVDDSNCRGFFDLGWLRANLDENIKVIITCTPGKISTSGLNKYNHYLLPALGDQAIDVVEHLLSCNGRKLVPTQYSSIKEVVNKSDKSGIYLKMLTEYLAVIPSWVDLSNTPSTFDGLMAFIVSRLSLPQSHGSLIVELVLGYLCIAREGLSDDEIRSLLSIDPILMGEINRQSLHRRDNEQELPPVYWTRLQFDLGGLISLRFTNSGLYNRFSHGRIKEYMTNQIRSNKDLYFYLIGNIYDFFKEKIVGGDRHAIYEVSRILRHATEFLEVAFKEDDSYIEEYVALKQEMFDLLTQNVQFIFSKYQIYYDDLLRDYSRYINFFARRCERNAVNYLLNFRKELTDFPRKADMEKLIFYAYNLPDSSIVKQQISRITTRSGVLINKWRNLVKRDSVITLLGEDEEVLGVSDDGNIMATKIEKGSKIRLSKIPGSSIKYNTRTFTLPTKYKSVIMAGSFNSMVWLSDTEVFVVDILENKNNLSWTVKADFCDISRDGRYIVIVYDGKNILYYDRSNGENIYQQLPSTVNSFKLSPSGRYLWMWLAGKGIKRYDCWGTRISHFGIESTIYVAGESVCVPFPDEDKAQILLCDIEGEESPEQIFTLSYETKELPNIWFDEKSNSLLFQKWNETIELPIKNGIGKIITHDRQPEFFSVFGQYAVLSGPNRLVKWREMFDEIHMDDVFNRGIGSFSVTRDGSIAVMSLGVNQLQERYNYIIYASDESIRKVHLPFNHDNYCLVTSVAISPDGEFIGACSSVGEVILVRTRDMSLIGSSKFDVPGCLGLSFSYDGKRLLAVNDHFISSPYPIIHIGETDSGRIYTIPGQVDWEKSENMPYMPSPQGESRFIHGSRYVSLGDYKIWDIDSKKFLLPFKNEIPYYTNDLHRGDVSHPPCECIFENPADGFIYSADKGSMTRFNPVTQVLEQCAVEYSLIGISRAGDVFYFIDEKRNLWVRSEILSKGIFKNVISIYPSIVDNHMLYVYTTDGYIVEIDVWGQEYGRAYVPDLWHAIPTERGLAVATLRGPMLFASGL